MQINSLLIALAAGVLLATGCSNEKVKQQAADPQIGDIYVVHGISEEPGYPYAMVQVFRTGKDTIGCAVAKYVYNMSTGFRDDIKANKHLDTAYWDNSGYINYGRNEIQKWADEGDLRNVYENQQVIADTNFGWTPEMQAFLDSLFSTLDMDSLGFDSTEVDTMLFEEVGEAAE